MQTVKFKEDSIHNYIMNFEYKQEELNFLKDNIDNSVYIQQYLENKNELRVSKYANSKIFCLPIDLFDFSNSENEFEENILYENKYYTKIKNIFKKFNIYFIHWIIWLLIISSVIVNKNYVNTNANLLTNEINNIELQKQNEFEKITNEINKNNFLISDELNKQKQKRDFIKKSIEKVKLLEAENLKKRDILIDLAQ